MKALPARLLTNLREVRFSAAFTVTLCDAIILGGGDRTDALNKLPAALRLLVSRCARAIEAVSREGQP